MKEIERTRTREGERVAREGGREEGKERDTERNRDLEKEIQKTDHANLPFQHDVKLCKHEGNIGTNSI